MVDFEVSGTASLDPAHIVENIDEIIAKLDEMEETIARLDESIDELSHKQIDISVLIDGQDKLDELKIFLDEISNQEYTVRLKVELSDKDKLDELYTEILELELHEHKVDLKVNVQDAEKARVELAALDKELANNKQKTDESKKSTEGFSFSLGMLAPLAIPAAAGILSLVGAAGGLVSVLGVMAPALRLVAYGMDNVKKSVSGVWKGLTAATQAQLENASSMQQATSILEKNSAAFRGMDANMRQATLDYVFLQGQLAGFKQAIEPEAVLLYGDAIDILAQAIGDLTPAAVNAGKALHSVLSDLSNRLQDPTFQKFFNDMAKNVGTLVKDWGGGVVNIIEGITAIMDAFLPLGVDMSGGFLKMTQSFDTWAQHLAQSEGFKKFVKTVETDGPLILGILGSLARIIANVVGAIGESSQNAGFLQWLDKTLKTLASFTSTHEGLTQAAGDLALLALGASKLGPALGPIISFLATPEGAIVAVILALGAAFLYAYNTSKTFHDWVNANFGPLFAKLGQDVTQVKQWFTQIWPEIQQIWDKYGKNIENIIVSDFGFIVTFIGGALKIIEGVIDIFIGILTGHWGLAWDGVKKIFSGAIQIIEGYINHFITTTVNSLEMLWTLITTNVSKGWSLVEKTVTTFTARIVGDVVKFFTNIVSSAITGMVQFGVVIANQIASVGSWFSRLPGEIANWLGDLSKTLWNAGWNLIAGLINGISSKVGDLKSYLGDITGWITSWKGPPEKDAVLLFNSGQLIIGGLINGLESKYSAVQTSLSGFTNSLGDQFSKQINSDIVAKINATTNSTANGVSGALANGNPAASGNSQVSIASGAVTIYNPTPEPASTTVNSLARQLTNVAKFGILQSTGNEGDLG